jgi:hypothetical protein
MKYSYAIPMSFLLISIFTGYTAYPVRATEKAKPNVTIVWQPSHQTDTGKDFNEAAVCNAIVEAAMQTLPKLNEYKVWSYGNKNLHHADSGSNTKIEHTSVIIDGKISGYAYEVQEANNHHPQIFIAIHNNGGTNRNAIWGYVHEGDKYESENRILADRLVKAVCAVTDLQNGGVLPDSSTGRNDYRCKTTGKLGFYSLDENINLAPYRVLLEIGDNEVSRKLLLSPEGQQKIGAAIKTALAQWIQENINK